MLGIVPLTTAGFTGLVHRCAAVPRCSTSRATALPRAELSKLESEVLLQAFFDEGGGVVDEGEDEEWLLDGADDKDEGDWLDDDDCEDADDDGYGDSKAQGMLDAFLADGGSLEEAADVTDDEAGIASDAEVAPAPAPTPTEPGLDMIKPTRRACPNPALRPCPEAPTSKPTRKAAAAAASRRKRSRRRQRVRSSRSCSYAAHRRWRARPPMARLRRCERRGSSVWAAR